MVLTSQGQAERQKGYNMNYNMDIVIEAEQTTEDEVCFYCILDDWDKNCNSCVEFLEYREKIMEQLSLER